MFFIILFGALLLDQVTKYAAYMFLQPQGVIPVVNNAFYLNYIENRGIASGIMQNKLWILVFVTAIICIGGYYIYKTPYLSSLTKYSLGLLAGGAFGNFFDSIRLGYVIDFFDLAVLPVFNLADVFVTAGASMLIFVLLLGREKTNQI